MAKSSAKKSARSSKVERKKPAAKAPAKSSVSCPSCADPAPKELRVGIVGLGWPGGMHLAGYRAKPGVRVTAICDIREEARKSFIEKQGLAGSGVAECADCEEMLARADVDAVSVCLPNFLHAPVALAALKGGKHVLSEKPPTMTAAEAGEIVDEAARRKLVYMYITQRRYSAEADEAARLIASGRLGDVYHAEAAWRRTSGIPIGAGGWFVDKARSGGGAFIDIGVHMLDIAWFLLGCPRPVCVQGAMHSRFGHAVPAGTKYDVDDFGAALISLEGGKTILVQASWALQQEKDEHYAKVYGTKGGLDFSPFTVYSTSETGQTVERPRLMRVDGFSANVGHFVDVVRGEAEPRTKAVHALHLMQMLEGAYASAAGARAVTVRP